MDKTNEKKPITPRRLGLSRNVSTFKNVTPNRSDVNLKMTPTNIPRSKQTAEDCLATPTKRTKLSSDECITISELGNVDQDIFPKNVQDVKAEISQMKKQLAAYDKYKGEEKELEGLIELWCNGGNDALQMLQEDIQPKQEIEQILTHLNLPIDIFNNV
ncbi:uncharacterized protein LOC116352363 [Contarinia nasturtii]|uniref:uncharacterized protein LOC116352363 n=1 Tax=Contarinia nasturtii TaxID=265458 RepID=UPI0012D44C92|nr:uncharacterized protein LOC116352363 [Contarinia nasturtii]